MATRKPATGYLFATLVFSVLTLCAMPAFGQATFFVAGPIVTVLDFGAIPNDATADTPALIAAMSGGGRTVRVPAGEYRIGKFEIPSNTVLELAPGAVLRDTGLLATTDPLITIRSENVRIVGDGAKVISSRSDYTSGEFRHGVFIRFARNVEITGLESSTHGGDGFYIGTGSRDLSIRNCRATNNRRQGMSIVSAVNLVVSGCSFSFTAGTNPSLGVDVEPNGPADLLQNVRLSSITTRHNNGGGIGVGLSAYGTTGPAASIYITLHSSIEESVPFATSSLRSFDVVRYSGPIIPRM